MKFLLEEKTKQFSFFIAQYHFDTTKNITLNSTHYYIITITIKWELQQIAFTNSSDIDLKSVRNAYKNALENHIIF